MAAKKHQAVVLGTSWGIRSSFRSLIAFLITALIITAVYLTQDSIGRVLELDRTDGLHELSECNLFSGKWVFDNQSYPLYKEQQCSFMSDQLACEKFGRKDLSYQNWRWQPHQCNLPRFNATALLETLRNKRLVFVGDSLNRNQWVSMVCLVDSWIPPKLRSMHNNDSLNIFKAIAYNATIEFYWAPLLVESNSDDPVNHRIPDRTVRIKAIEKHARHWTGGDILVFDSYLWWRRPRMKVLAKDWGGGENCYKETGKISEEGYWGSDSDPKMMRVVEMVLEDLKTRGLNVQMLNITQLSEYRKEGHPSIYRKQWEPLTKEQIENPSSYADCIHWCLPGLPDVWNELLYAYIVHQ
ncbi:hypothetical protein F2P56_008279 [Juglans regia]|uniref:Protein trichome birefringence-like 34 n=1 Tax=Juglans regia TaxID=51240 RepID=A0A833XMS7_JUGRE|nr:hypothetical protein F2P56_008279 [Juglans regia]